MLSDLLAEHQSRSKRRLRVKEMMTWKIFPDRKKWGKREGAKVLDEKINDESMNQTLIINGKELEKQRMRWGQGRVKAVMTWGILWLGP